MPPVLFPLFKIRVFLLSFDAIDKVRYVPQGGDESSQKVLGLLSWQSCFRQVSRFLSREPWDPLVGTSVTPSACWASSAILLSPTSSLVLSISIMMITSVLRNISMAWRSWQRAPPTRSSYFPLPWGTRFHRLFPSLWWIKSARVILLWSTLASSCSQPKDWSIISMSMLLPLFFVIS